MPTITTSVKLLITNMGGYSAINFTGDMVSPLFKLDDLSSQVTGSNNTFRTSPLPSGTAYIPGSLWVFWNQILQNFSSPNIVTDIDPATGEFQLGTGGSPIIPPVGTSIIVRYIAAF